MKMQDTTKYLIQTSKSVCTYTVLETMLTKLLCFTTLSMKHRKKTLNYPEATFGRSGLILIMPPIFGLFINKGRQLLPDQSCFLKVCTLQ